MLIKRLVLLLGISIWPLSLFLANTPGDFGKYIIPAILLAFGFFLKSKDFKLYFLPILIIALIEPKLALFPLIFFLFQFAFEKRRYDLLLAITSLLVLIFSWKSFYGQTIFVPDYEARQEVIRETQLYDSVLLARLFHNKVRIVFDKFTFNFFALTDPGNFFFGFHPRQIVGNQNLTKLPFLGLIFVLFGIYYLNGYMYKSFLVSSFVAGILSLSILTLFDRNDFILWVPTSLFFFFGVNQFAKKIKYANIFFIVFFIFAIPEFIRLLVSLLT